MRDRAPLMQFTDDESRVLLSANLNSFVLDYAARSAMSRAGLNFFIVKQLPVLPPDVYLEEALPNVKWVDFIIPRALELNYTSWEMKSFAEDIGYEGTPFRWDNERRFLLRYELDAAFFHMYGLERDDVDYIMDTFPGVKRDDNNAHGEYRTKRIILEIYDDLANCMRNCVPYETRLSPPPADASVAHTPDTQEVSRRLR